MLINREFFYKYSPFPSNYDLTEVWNYVTVAEKLYILPLIGQDLYDELKEQINAPSGGTLTEENSTLLTEGCLWQLLGFATAYEALPTVWVKFSEAGLQLGKSENSDSITLKDLTLIQQHLQNQINGLRQTVLDFLCSHVDSYQKFDTSVCPNCNCTCGSKNTKLLFKPVEGTIRKQKDLK